MRGPTSIAFWGGFAFVVGARYTVFSVLACIFIFRPANPDAGYLLLWAFILFCMPSCSHLPIFGLLGTKNAARCLKAGLNWKGGSGV